MSQIGLCAGLCRVGAGFQRACPTLCLRVLYCEDSNCAQCGEQAAPVNDVNAWKIRDRLPIYIYIYIYIYSVCREGVLYECEWW